MIIIRYLPAIIGAIPAVLYIGVLVFGIIITRAFRGRINHRD